MMFEFTNQIGGYFVFPMCFVGVDVWYAGLATHYCHSSQLPKLESALLALEDSNDVESVLNEFCPVPKLESTLSKHIDQINRSFDASTVEEIVYSLEKDDSEWAKQTLNVYHQKNIFPLLSLKLR